MLGVLALTALAALVMVIAGVNPIDGFFALFHGALGGVPQIGETLVQTTALLFPSLAVAFAFRAGLFNIGAEGQLLIGGLCAGLAGAKLGWIGAAAILPILLAGAAGGGLWAAIAGGIRARRGGNEVIATLMLNILAVLAANALLSGPLHAWSAVVQETPMIPRAAWLPTILPGSRLTVALPAAVLLALLMRYFFARTISGYELRACGDAPQAAKRAGIDVERVSFAAMIISGAIAGLGGATIVDGVLHRFNTGLSPGYGFIAIAVALVGNLDASRIMFASLVFGILQSGALAMQAFAHVPKDAVAVIEGLAIVGLATRRSSA